MSHDHDAPTHSHDSGQGSVQGVPGWVWGILVTALVLALGYNACSGGDDEPTNTPVSTPVAQKPTTTTEALVLERECYTPCSVNIAWRFRILRTEAIRVKWNGFDGWIEYPAKGDLRAPSQMRSGQTEFESADPEHPTVRVQVYRKVTVTTPR